MSIGFYINGKKYDLSFGMGWYKGSEWCLLTLGLFETHEWDGEINLVSIINLQFLKFSLSLSANRKE